MCLTLISYMSHSYIIPVSLLSCTYFTRFSLISHICLTLISHLFHSYITPISLLSHMCLTLISHLSHFYLTPISLLSHFYLTFISHVSHSYLTPVSLLSHTYLTFISHLSHTYFTRVSLLSHFYLIRSQNSITLTQCDEYLNLKYLFIKFMTWRSNVWSNIYSICQLISPTTPTPPRLLTHIPILTLTHIFRLQAPLLLSLLPPFLL